jgi:4-hydroxybutyrate CoA-transferase
MSAVRSAALAVEPIRSGDRVLVMGCLGEPEALVDALLARTDLEAVTAYQVMSAARGAITRGPAWLEAVPLVPSGHGGDPLPSTIHGVSRWLADGTLAIDVVLMQVAPPEGRRASLGVCVDFMAQACERARYVAAEVNAAMPSTRGDCRIPVDRLDAAVPVDRPLREVAVGSPDPVAEAIGRHCAQLVPPDATVEVGVGTIPSAVLSALADRPGLAVHTGAISDGVVPLLPRLERPVVCTQAIGSRSFTRALHENDAFDFQPCSVTHDTRRIAAIPRFMAIQAALSVDLRGQANLEVIDGRTVGGAGGAADFARGATLSPGGRSIVALPATARGGSVSRIVAGPGPRGAVTLPAHDVDYVVTEYGVAALRGRTLAERAEALIGVAPPEFRAALRKAARA